MDLDTSWLGTIWSYRAGRTLIGKVTSKSGDFVTMTVAGLDKALPTDLQLMKPGSDGAPRVRVDVEYLVTNWKQMGPTGG